MASAFDKITRWRRTIGARELAEFVYCAKSWDFSRRYGIPPDAKTRTRLAVGRQGHADEGAARQAAERAIRRERWVWLWLIPAVLLLLWFLWGTG